MIDVEDLIEAVDIVDFISQYTDLTPKGGELWGLSPLKEEQTPSFSVDPEKQCFYDFSSGNSGGVIQFIQALYGCSKHKAIVKLTKYVEENGGVQKKNRLDVNKVCKKYGRTHEDDQLVEPELKKLPDEIMEKYIWSEKQLEIWNEEGISYNVMRNFGVRYDPMSNRIVYPIRDLQGSIINIGARTLDPLYKEKGLRKYTYLRGWGSGMRVIYGLYENLPRVKETGYLILFEGAKSVLKAASWGVRNTGAILTSHLNPHQITILLSICTINNVAVIFALDKDVNIADDKNIRKLKNYLRVYYLRDDDDLLEPKDAPVDKGFEVFKQLCRDKKILR